MRIPRLQLCPGLLVACALLSGCAFLQLHRDLAEKRESATLRGEVRTEHPTDLPIVVFVYTGENGSEKLVQYFVLAGPGPYFFVVPAGAYHVAAFEDVNLNFSYDPGVDPSALLGAGEPVAAPSGGALNGLDIEIRDAHSEPIPFDFSSADRAGPNDRALPEARLGEVTGIDDSRFSDANARRGLWQPLDFRVQVGAGIYFLEPYDPRKIPVLFVHGAMGHPGNWGDLIAKLDRDHFQPWLVYYPTAQSLEKTALSLDRWVQYLFVLHRYPCMAVVAHSMGGLVARAFINRAMAAGDGRADGLRLFVTVSTPWDGHAAAQTGVSRAPVVAPSWYDMAPQSPFLHSLLEAELPHTLTFDLLFSYSGRSRLLLSGPNDGVVTLASQLVLAAQDQATTVRGFNETHTGVLRSSDVSNFINAQLAALATTTGVCGQPSTTQ